MTINEIKDFLTGKPGYLKKSAEVLSGRLECDVELCETALYESRKRLRNSLMITPTVMKVLSVSSKRSLTRMASHLVMYLA